MTAVKKTKAPLEEWEQKQIFQWIRANQIRYPQLQLAYGTFNGIRVAPKLRTKMYEQGNRKGVPDIVCPFKAYGGMIPGMYIELKRVKGGTVSPEQKNYMELLRGQGYFASVCKGHRDAIETIKTYLGVEA